MSTGRSLQECATKLQPGLDAIARRTTQWKVKRSSAKCVMTTFTLDQSESNGKVLPRVSFTGHELAYEEEPVFLGVKFDGGPTFAPYVDDLKKKMTARRRCLEVFAGKTYGCHRDTLRAVYRSYIYTQCLRLRSSSVRP